MNVQQTPSPTSTPFTPFTNSNVTRQSIDLKSIITKYLYHWPLFVIGLILALTAAFFYVQMAQPYYEVKATLLIKDDKKMPDQKSALDKIDLLNSATIIENEIEILKSKQLISQVVQDLQLGTIYQKKDGLSYQDLYQSSPVKLTLINSTGNLSQGIVNLAIKNDQSFSLILPNGKSKDFSYKSTFKNNFGIWKLEPTKALTQYKGATIKITLLDPDKLALRYQTAIDASLPNKLTTAVVLSIWDEVPQRGKDILNRLIYNYNLAATSEKKRETKSTLDFIDQRLASLNDELTAAEKGIAGFKSSRGITDISADSKISLENMQANDTRLNEVNVQLSVIDGIERYVNSSQNSGRAPATLGITDPALSSLIEKLSTLQLQRERLLATTPETNPDFEPINRQIVTTRAAIKENVRNIKSSLLNTQGKLQSFNSRFESSIKNIPTEERQYVSKKRQQESKESLYTYLLQKREEMSVTYASTLTDDRIVDQAYAGPAKDQKKSLIYAAAMLLGLGLPAGLIYARNSFSDKITTLQEIKDAVSIPVLSELPFELSQNPVVTNDLNSNVLVEQFRSLRTKLYYLFGEKEHGRVTLLTSSVAGEGKSFVSTNLATSLANADRKTVILELDLRKPKVAETFNLSKEHVGISDFLKGNATQTDIIQACGLVPNLDIISSGTIVQNPSELLEKKQLKDLISSLRNTYDDIIIDSPPVHLVPDAMILSRLTDITLYVIRQGFTEKAELDFIKELYQQKQLPNINLIFNGIERAKYGYGYHYSNNYYNISNKSKGTNSIFSDFKNRF
ncbi:MAG: GumC family protein [Janthinobacterium lividum]